MRLILIFNRLIIFFFFFLFGESLRRREPESLQIVERSRAIDLDLRTPVCRDWSMEAS